MQPCMRDYCVKLYGIVNDVVKLITFNFDNTRIAQ
jgi:hypothetical protein